MILLHNNASFTLPVTDAILVFTILLLSFLVFPLLLRRFNVPDIIGLIIAGALLGPNGFNVLERGETIRMFGAVGVVYIMFLAGLEIDLRQFKRNRIKSVQLGMLTFSVPVLLGFGFGYFLLHYNFTTALLFGILFSPHTLVAYPIVRRLGIVKNEAVTVVMGSTLITDTLALLILALVSDSVQGGISGWSLLYFAGGLGVCLLLVLKLLLPLARWFFKNVESKGVNQYLFTLAFVFLSASVMVLFHIEPIVGAFLAGLALNALVPHTSPLMARISFAGNALFIPFFLFGVGMLADISLFWQDAGALALAAGMVGIATFGKLIPAWVMQKLHGYHAVQRNILFGLSYSKAAAALAISMVGYNLGIFDYAVQNGVIIVILVTCLIGPFIVEQAGLKIAMAENKGTDEKPEKPERILVSVANPSTIEQLIDFAILIKNPSSKEPLIPLAVVTDDHEVEAKVRQNQKMLEKALVHAAATDTPVLLSTRVDLNPASGIVRAAKEMLVTDVILGYNENRTAANAFFGTLLDIILQKLNQTIVVVKATHPLNAVKRIVLALPPGAEAEHGFRHCLAIVRRLSQHIGASVLCLANQPTADFLEEYKRMSRADFEFSVQLVTNWQTPTATFPPITSNDLFTICLGRTHSVSYNAALDEFSRHLAKHLKNTGFIFLYPGQN
ncbi:cation:proton antiporter [Sphingobacteriales bacterium UPWRP_1]|nr:hypothetical protein BVG80_17150 [Sphingobacteriales bacterium TSM_CSM]PSJ74226.1 cation:proton antiporter [Sphingobacteriales bacterium UPWRP_1]